MTKEFLYGGVFGLFAVFCMFVIVPPMEAKPMYKAPAVASQLPKDVTFDCVLLQYKGEGQTATKAGQKMLESLGGGRVITYPDGYVPVLVPKDKVDAVKKLLGDKAATVLSPNMEK